MGSLKNFLDTEQGRNLKLSDLINLITDTCKGMLHLQNNNLVHRDLAARNLLIYFKDNNWSAKVSDFGMARKLNDSTYTNNTLLPIRWTAPEVIKTQIYFKESDIWSFGVTCWEILSRGKLPFYELDSNSDVAYMITHGTILQKPEECPENIWIIIEKCFLQEFTQRPSFYILLERLSINSTNRRNSLISSQHGHYASHIENSIDYGEVKEVILEYEQV